MSFMIPTDKRQLRACLLCSLVKNTHQFRKNGCENCEEYLDMRGSMDRVMECTSSNFDGIIALMEPSRSWVGKWNHLESFYPGIYASYVSGRIPEDVEDMLAERGITYHPKDGTQAD